jgi:hypothetical protein
MMRSCFGLVGLLSLVTGCQALSGLDNLKVSEGKGAVMKAPKPDGGERDGAADAASKDAGLADASLHADAATPSPDAAAGSDAGMDAGGTPPVDSGTPPSDSGTDSGPDAAMSCTLTCAAHEMCSRASGTPACVCVPGYALSAGVCVWEGLPLDPGFRNMPASAWTLEQGAVIDATAPGNIEAGQVSFDKATLCTSRGRARQTLTMPTLAQAEPLALKLASSGDCIANGGMSCTNVGLSAPGINVSLNGGANLFGFNSVSAIQFACLGERAYGGTMDLVVRPSSRAACASATTIDAVVDHVDIEPSATCPMPGTIPNAGFTDTSNWTPSVVTANSPPPVAEILVGGGHVNTNDSCQQAMFQGPISPPLSLIPNLALAVSYTGTPSERLVVELGGTRIATLPGSSAPQTAKVCLPEGSKGMTQTALFGLVFPLPGIGVGCGAHVRDFTVSNLAFVSDPTCPATSYVTDPGFERTDVAAMWDSALSTNSVMGGVATASIDTTAADAHSGSRSLQLVSNTYCGYSQVWFPISVPASSGSSGPVLRFYFKAPTLTSSTVSIAVGPANAPSGTITATGSYTQAQICLDPTLAGQTQLVSIRMTGGPGGGCNAAYATETLWLDDISVETSSACQAD